MESKYYFKTTCSCQNIAEIVMHEKQIGKLSRNQD